MGTRARIFSLTLTALGAVLVSIGVVYLTVACEDLPGILGPTPGDTSPRTALGVIGLIFGLAALTAAVGVARRRRDSAPHA